MIKKASFILLATLATLVGIYPIIYFIIDRKFGLLNSKSEALLSSALWNTNFYVHIIFGGVALLVGWTQFVPKWRRRNVMLHRQVGKVYVFSVLVSAVTAIYIAFFATGGLIPSAGFVGMGIVWFFTTFKAFRYIKGGEVISHQRMMVYSYATCLAAVTLRIYLPIFISLFNDFDKAYAVVAWLSWVPNLFVAYAINKNILTKSGTGTGEQLSMIPAEQVPLNPDLEGRVH